MLGAIIGDIVGSHYEFNNTKDYNFELFAEPSSYTDDTVMTMAIAWWLLHDKEHSHKGLEDAMVTFAEKYPCPMGGYGGGFRKWLFSSGKRQPYNSWGNGSAMRVSAVGWFLDTLEETERVAEISAAITHNHPEGIKGAKATAAAIFMARNGAEKHEIREYIISRFGYDLSKPWKEWHDIYKWDESCQGTVPQALICFIESASFEEAIRRAVSLGGDSDTLACITGGIAEAYYGFVPATLADPAMERLPEEFKEVLYAFADASAYKCRIALID